MTPHSAACRGNGGHHALSLLIVSVLLAFGAASVLFTISPKCMPGMRAPRDVELPLGWQVDSDDSQDVLLCIDIEGTGRTAELRAPITIVVHSAYIRAALRFETATYEGCKEPVKLTAAPESEWCPAAVLTFLETGKIDLSIASSQRSLLLLLEYAGKARPSAASQSAVAQGSQLWSFAGHVYIGCACDRVIRFTRPLSSVCCCDVSYPHCPLMSWCVSQTGAFCCKGRAHHNSLDSNPCLYCHFLVAKEVSCCCLVAVDYLCVDALVDGCLQCLMTMHMQRIEQPPHWSTTTFFMKDVSDAIRNSPFWPGACNLARLQALEAMQDLVSGNNRLTPSLPSDSRRAKFTTNATNNKISVGFSTRVCDQAVALVLSCLSRHAGPGPDCCFHGRGPG